MSLKLRIMCKAVRIRMDAGENLDDILASYPRLSYNEKNQIRQEVTNE